MATVVGIEDGNILWDDNTGLIKKTPINVATAGAVASVFGRTGAVVLKIDPELRSQGGADLEEALHNLDRGTLGFRKLGHAQRPHPFRPCTTPSRRA